VLVTLPASVPVTYGQPVTLNCRIEVPQPKPGEPFRYDRYLASRGIEALCLEPTNISWTDAREVPFTWRTYLLGKVAAFHDLLYRRAAQLWNEPESSFIMGVLFGGSSNLPSYLQESFQRTGLSHVLAVSGFNVTIIASALMSLLVLVGLWRRQAYWITMSALIGFVILTGATASVVRAAVMGILVLTAEYLGRRSHIAPALACAAALMLALNPFLLVYDAGFQLSFLATMGLVYLSPRLTNSLPQKTPETLITTLAAIGMTLPLMLYQFGLMSLVAPLINVLLLWSVPFLMLGSFVALAMGLIFLPVGALAAIPAAIAARVFINIVVWFSHLRFAAVSLTIPWWAMVVAYIALLMYLLNGRASAHVKRYG
jgi:competence protein ComEC